MKVRFLSGYDRVKTLFNIITAQGKQKHRRIAENITPKQINPKDIKADIQHILDKDIVITQNKGMN